MDHSAHHSTPSVNRLAASATTHCLTGCAIGEILGVIIATALGLELVPGLALAIGLAFVFGYGFTVVPLLRTGLTVRRAIGTALAADTISIATMEATDNGFALAVPGAMDAGIGHPLFWGALALGLLVAWPVTFLVNRWLIARGRGHAIVHGRH
jgi:hypothetical protein